MRSFGAKLGMLVETYIGFTRNALLEAYTYRLRMLIWIIYDFVILFVQYFLWTAIFQSGQGSIQGISLSKYLSYVALGLIFSRAIACRIDGDIAQEIKDGNIAMNLLKPLNYFTMVVARRIGYTMADLIALIPVVLVIITLIPFETVSALIVVETVISMIFAYILVTVFTFLLGILAFWITNYWGLFLFKGHMFALFSGEVIALSLLFKLGSNKIENFPIPFLDEGFMQSLFLGLGVISYCLPFQAMNYTPGAIMTGMIEGQGAILLHLALQLFWVLGMSLLTWHVWQRAQRRITIMGG